LKSIDAAKSGKWRKYLQIKKNIYLAYVCFSFINFFSTLNVLKYSAHTHSFFFYGL